MQPCPKTMMKEYREHAPRFIEREPPLPDTHCRCVVVDTRPYPRPEPASGILIFMEAGRVGLRCPRTRREIICPDLHTAFVRARELNWQFPAESAALPSV